ncbi:CopG family transcriptional regulator [Oculatella sp. LEGE 06141]|uniref:ribbon-helix-helix domain-containing protein n=1 Tax=Oculatella sp. LEGE 06141 TaxID=1828648 RepID=UPI0018804FB4|nr:ribbon-helix-helix domain-containing protein [Oculatella sp. LEGE 06141]MBE9181727.1 CopG family transcriptional regulator [Oculatella sp. LEGE 06141]
MANPFIGVRIPRELAEALDARIKQTGQSKSDFVIEALRLSLGVVPCQARLSDVERRLSALEETTQAVSKALTNLQGSAAHHADRTHTEAMRDASDHSLENG